MCAALCLCVLCGIAVVGASAASQSFSFSLQLASAANCRSYGNKYYSLPTPTRYGYTFDGWYTKITGGTEVTRDTTVATAANHTLYAHWSLTPAKAPTNVKLEMAETSVYGAEFSRRVSSASTIDYTTTYTWYACDENGDNGIPITDENGDPTYPTTPTAGVHYYYVLVTATRKDNGLQASTKSNVVCVTVTKATPKITEPPTAAALDLAVWMQRIGVSHLSTNL